MSWSSHPTIFVNISGSAFDKHSAVSQSLKRTIFDMDVSTFKHFALRPIHSSIHSKLSCDWDWEQEWELGWGWGWKGTRSPRR